MSKAFASDVMIDLMRIFRRAHMAGDKDRAERIMIALDVMEKEYPDAAAEIERLYGVAESSPAATDGETG